jgi:formiminoglutamase
MIINPGKVKNKMELNDYFNPVSLDKPQGGLIPGNLSFSRSLTIHTANNPLRNTENFDLAIVGIPEEKNALIKGPASAPDAVREKLYQLSSVNRKTKVIDLGNLKITGNINDTYYALRDITTELRQQNVAIIYIGGSQDLTYGINLGFEKLHPSFTLGTIDARFDFGFHDTNLNSSNYLESILQGRKPSEYNYFNIGHQAYFTHLKITDQFEKMGYDFIRLGSAREDLVKAEPYLRDAGLISVDMGCVRHSDAPGVTIPSPNGFFGHELCQLARFAGSGSYIEGIGFFELSPENDINKQTSHLTAQAIWYFIDGYSLKFREKGNTKGNKKYHVSLNEPGQEIVFLKSATTDRWWMELPFHDTSGKKILVACSYADYLQACNREIPDRYWKACNRFS